jgi:hypothetical protein
MKGESMSVKETMEESGFNVSSSGGGCLWYTKLVEYEGNQAFIAITDEGGLELPESLDDPVLVGIYDMDSGDELEPCQEYGTLQSYLESLKE